MTVEGMTLRELVLLAMLDDGRGTVEAPYPFQSLNAATLADLRLGRLVSFSGDVVSVRHGPRPHDPTRRSALASLQASASPRTLEHWVRTLHQLQPPPCDCVLLRLVMGGVLSLDEAVQMGLTPAGTFPAGESGVARETAALTRSAIYGLQPAGARALALLAILDAGRLLPRVLGRAEACAARTRTADAIGADRVASAVWHSLARAVDPLRAAPASLPREPSAALI